MNLMMNDAKLIQCFTFHKYGHKSFECKMRKEKNPAVKASGRSGVRYANVHLIICSSVERTKTVQNLLQRINLQKHSKIHLLLVAEAFPLDVCPRACAVCAFWQF